MSNRSREEKITTSRGTVHEYQTTYPPTHGPAELKRTVTNKEGIILCHCNGTVGEVGRCLAASCNLELTAGMSPDAQVTQDIMKKCTAVALMNIFDKTKTADKE